MAKIVVIGAGVTGLSFAASCRDADITILEADDDVGGYCRTTYKDEFVWDRAGHFFHFQNASVANFFNAKMQEEDFSVVRKKTSILLPDGSRVDFPFQANIHQLDEKTYAQALDELQSRQAFNQSNARSFKEFVYGKYGPTISDLFLIPYNEKLYATDLNELEPDAMGRFFPRVDLDSILKSKSAGRDASYNSVFKYPRRGARQFVEVLESEAQKNANIKCSTSVIEINERESFVKTEDGSREYFDLLVSTIPLPRLTSLISDDSFSVDNMNLSANKVLVFNIGFKGKAAVDDHWMYFPGEEVFYRVGCYHNIFRGQNSSLYVEIGRSSEANYDEEELLMEVLEDLKKVGLYTSQMRYECHEFVIMDPAYVHISKKSEQIKTNLFERLRSRRIISAGRYGAWKYCSIEDNILEAREIAEELGKIDLLRYYDFLSEL